MISKKLFFLYILWFCNVEITKSNSVFQNFDLELVQVLFRHGARTPICCEVEKLNGISNESSYAPYGYAQLTNQGKQQEFEIGKMLRKRYADFLPELYNRDHVYAYSSDVSRTKMSLALVLAALYPPTGPLIWNEDLKWNPIPIYSDPRPMDILNKGRDCPEFEDKLDELLNSEEVLQYSKEYKETFEIMENIYEKKLNHSEMFCIYNALLIQKNLNLTLPTWFSNELHQKILKVSEFYVGLLSSTPTLKRFNGGPYVRRFVENIEKSNKKQNRRKIYLYSAHDKSLHAYLNTHSLNVKKIPEYGSAVILEKYGDKQGKKYVQILFWTGNPKTMKIMKLNDCNEMCPWDEYLKIVTPILPSDEDMMCLYRNKQPTDIKNIFNTDNTDIES